MSAPTSTVLVLGDQDLQQDAGDGGGDLGVDLVRGHLNAWARRARRCRRPASSHVVTVPSVTDSPSAGMVTEVAIVCSPAQKFRSVVDVERLAGQCHGHARLANRLILAGVRVDRGKRRRRGNASQFTMSSPSPICSPMRAPMPWKPTIGPPSTETSLMMPDVARIATFRYQPGCTRPYSTFSSPNFSLSLAARSHTNGSDLRVAEGHACGMLISVNNGGVQASNLFGDEDALHGKPR